MRGEAAQLKQQTKRPLLRSPAANRPFSPGKRHPRSPAASHPHSPVKKRPHTLAVNHSPTLAKTRPRSPVRTRPRRQKRGAGWKALLFLLLLLTAGCGLFQQPETVGGRGGGNSGGDESDAPAWLPGSNVQLPDYVEPDLLPVNAYSRPGTYLRVINGVVIHYVGNPGSTARGNRKYFANLSDGREGRYASSHFIVGLDGEVIQCVPLTEIAYCSNQRNSDTISIEVCHPDEGGQFSDVTYSRVVELTAWLCDTFGLDPAREVIRHYDVTGKECPRYYVRHPEAWDQFRSDVAALLPWAGGGRERES